MRTYTLMREYIKFGKNVMNIINKTKKKKQMMLMPTENNQQEIW